MKNKMLNSMTLLTLLTLVSCGQGGNSKAKLEISSGFLVGNTGFDGGLIITGKNNTTGDSFSVDLATGVQSQMELPKGSWTFLAVGWDGGPSGKKFGGKPFCGRTDAALQSDAQTVNLNVTVERCATDDSFADAEYTESVGAGVIGPNTMQAFRKLNRIQTCNSFFDHFSGITNNTVISSVLYTKTNHPDSLFCTSGRKMPLDLQSEVKSFKIYALNKTLAQTAGAPGFSSPCLYGAQDYYPAASGDYSGSTPLRLPTKIPLVVETFKDDSCAKSLATFPFKNGLQGDNAVNFDNVFHDDTVGNVLILPGNDIRRAISPFVHILPDFRCFNGSTSVHCKVLPTVAGFDHYGYIGNGNRIFDNTRNICPAIATITSSPAGISNISCIQEHDGISLNYDMAGAPGLIFIQISGVTAYSVQFASARTALDDARVHVRKRLLDLIGYDSPTFPRSFFDEGHDNDTGKDSFGALADVREMLNAPSAVVGIPDPTLSFANACLSSSGTKTLSLYDKDEMKLKTYRIEIGAPTGAAVSGYFCDAEAPSAVACANVFDKEIQIFDYDTSPVIPRIRVKMNCNQPFGKFISLDEKNEGVNRRFDRKLISWNTGSQTKGRFEKISIENSFDMSTGTPQLQSERREMVRLENIDGFKFGLWDYGFETQINVSGTWNQRMYSGQMTAETAGTVLSYDLDLNLTTNPTYNYFLIDAASWGPTRTIAPLTSSNVPNNSFTLQTSWTTVQTNIAYGQHVNVNTTNNLINGNLQFNLDSLKLLEGAFSGP